MLWHLRRMLAMVRGPRLNSMLLAMAKLVHGRRHGDEFLRQRISYMYLVPYRCDGGTFRREMAESGLSAIAECDMPGAGLGAPRLRFIAFRGECAGDGG
jgi:hypothetical protein